MNNNEQVNSQKEDFKSHTLPLAFLLFICFWSTFYNIGVINMDSMEARNLVTAREILENDNWLIPTMNGELRIVKPPLPTWLAALVSLSVGGTDKLSLLRLPNAFVTLLLIFCTYGLAWTMSRDRTLALMAAAILATNILVMDMGHKASWDIFSHAFMLGALWAFMVGMRENRGWPVFAVFGTLMGLSFMSKGPVSFFALLLPFILSYFWIFRARDLRKKWPFIILAVAICLVVSGLWPLYILNFHPEAVAAVAQQESQAWAHKSVGPFWYYWFFPTYGGLWLVISIAVLIKPFVEKRVKSIQDYRFLLLWLVLAIILLSIIPEKKARYLLPAMIPLALLGGSFLRAIMVRFQQQHQEKGDLLIITLHTGLITIIGIVFPSILFYQLHIINETATLLLFIPIFALFFVMIASGWVLFSKKNVFGLLVLTALQFCFMAFLYMDFYDDASIRNPEYKTMINIDSALLPQEMDILLMERVLGVKYTWDLKHRIKRWQLEEARQLLDDGKTIAVITAGEPAGALAEVIGEEVEIQIIDRFDYDKKRPQKKKTFLSRVRLRE